MDLLIQRLGKCTIIAFVPAAECKHTKNCYSLIALPSAGVEHPSFYIAERGVRDSRRPLPLALPHPCSNPRSESAPSRVGISIHIPHNLQESLRTSENSSALNPVRFGQLAQLPASGTRASSLLLNGATDNSSRMLDSIHAASNAECVFM